MISFNADSSKTTLSVSYHVMRLFSKNRVTSILPVTNSDTYGPAYWVAGVNANSNTYIWKGAVYNTSSTQSFTIAFPGLSSGKTAQLTVLTAPSGPYAMNVLGGPNVVNSAVITLTASGSGFSFDLPQWSVAVLNWAVSSGISGTPNPAPTTAPQPVATGDGG
jgi:alpha-L-arabinofuranosidase